jgi:hypothetical protein
MSMSSDHMTPHPGDWQTKIANTVEGQASWGEPNLRKTCRECSFWACQHPRPKRTRWGALEPAPCRKASIMLGRKKLLPVPHSAIACKFFEQRPTPPLANVNPGSGDL